MGYIGEEKVRKKEVRIGGEKCEME
jgi:hypothetical protein